MNRIASQTITIILPAYNEATVIARSLDAHLEWRPPDGFVLREIIVVDDGSTDRTPDIVAAYERAHAMIRLIRTPANRGKGAALKFGVGAAAEGDVIGCVDADLAYPPHVYDGFVAPFRTASSDLTIGNRYHGAHRAPAGYPLHRRITSCGFRCLTRMLCGIPFNDTQCGIKFFTYRAAAFLFHRLASPGYLYDLDVLCMAAMLPLRVMEIPVTIHASSESAIRVHRQLAPVARDLLRFMRRRLHRPAEQIQREWQVFNSS